jgi:hypothetical protein
LDNAKLDLADYHLVDKFLCQLNLKVKSRRPLK